jgi:multidrug transporter EmrE-like cation transporter
MQNQFIKAGGSAVGIIVLNNLPVGMILLPWCLLTIDFSQIPISSLILLFLNGLCWTVACFYRTLSYELVDASIARIFGTMNLVLLTLSGIYLFGEQLTFLNLAGLLLTVAAILITVDFSSVRVTRAVKYILISCIFTAIAVSMMKYLSETLPVELIVMCDFLLPGLSVFLLTSKRFHRCKLTLKASRNWVLVLPILCAVGYYSKICAFALGGELVVISILEQMGLLFVLALEFLVIKAIPGLRRRCLAGGLCSAGAVLVVAF